MAKLIRERNVEPQQRTVRCSRKAQDAATAASAAFSGAEYDWLHAKDASPPRAVLTDAAAGQATQESEAAPSPEESSQRLLLSKSERGNPKKDGAAESEQIDRVFARWKL